MLCLNCEENMIGFFCCATARRWFLIYIVQCQCETFAYVKLEICVKQCCQLSVIISLTIFVF